MPSTVPLHAFLFGEDQGRYVVACASDIMFDLRREAAEAGVTSWYLGLTGGHAIAFPDEDGIPVSSLREAHEGWLPAYMEGSVNAVPAAEAA